MKKDNKLINFISDNKTMFVFLVFLLISSILFSDRNFLAANNMVNILLKSVRNGGMLAIGMTFVIIAGEIDLSGGAVLALSGVVMGLVGAYNPVLGIIAGIGVGIISGLLIGFMVNHMKISSWIASLAMLFGVRGLILILAERSIPIQGDILTFANTNLFRDMIPGLNSGVSILIFIFFAIVLISMFALRHTRFGTSLYAVGGNSEAAKMMGINVNKIKMSAFILSGVLASLSGVLLASNSGSATLSAGNIYETYAIAMCAIGGVKLSGGEGKMSGTFFGILIFFTINTLFTYMPQLTVHWQSIIMGALVLLTVALQSDTLKGITRFYAQEKVQETVEEG